MRHTALLAAGLAALSLTITSCSSGSTTAGRAVGETTSTSAATSTSASTHSTPARATSTHSSSSGGGAVHVCSLLSSAQASSINGVTYGATVAKSVTAGYDTCTYHNSGQHKSPIDIQDLTVTVVSIAGCWTELKSADGPGKSIAGLGDEAFGTEISIDVEAGDRCLTVSGLTDAELRGDYRPDISMARIILTRLH